MSIKKLKTESARLLFLLDIVLEGRRIVNTIIDLIDKVRKQEKMDWNFENKENWNR